MFLSPGIRNGAKVALVLLAAYGAIEYLLPLALPFLLGTALALAAEPLVRFLCARFRVPRPLAAGAGVTMAFSFLVMVLMVVCGLAVRQLKNLAGILPDMEQTFRTGMDALSGWLQAMAQKAPGGLGRMLTEQIRDLFSGGAALLEKATGWAVNLATGILGRVPDSALLLGTGIISSFMISAKLPKIRQFLKKKLPVEKIRPLLESFNRLKGAVFGWLKAQIKLCGVTFLVVAAGLMLLRIPHGIWWALAIAVVDALPVFGAGAALIPWSLVSFLQGDRIQAFGLLGIYAAVAVTRTVLEPRLVGKQLGLDPLVTLAALYAGYRLWGIGGMILAPMGAVMLAQLNRDIDVM